MKFLQPELRLLADLSSLRTTDNPSSTKMFSLANFEERAKEIMDKEAWDYYASGANLQQSLRDNVEAFSKYIASYSTNASINNLSSCSKLILISYCFLALALYVYFTCHKIPGMSCNC